MRMVDYEAMLIVLLFVLAGIAGVVLVAIHWAEVIPNPIADAVFSPAREL
jgi:hypothetical protein